jgi:hypothetical protein
MLSRSLIVMSNSENVWEEREFLDRRTPDSEQGMRFGQQWLPQSLLTPVVVTRRREACRDHVAATLGWYEGCRIADSADPLNSRIVGASHVSSVLKSCMTKDTFKFHEDTQVAPGRRTRAVRHMPWQSACLAANQRDFIQIESQRSALDIRGSQLFSCVQTLPQVRVPVQRDWLTYVMNDA